MIYDCFTFFNELELLELRFNELSGVVDKFVLVEATKTFSNRSKPLHFQENQARFARFQDRIIHVVVEDSPASADAWQVERFQRNCIARGLTRCRPDDIVMVSDLDEIPRPSVVAKVAAGLRLRQDPLSNFVQAFLNSGGLKKMCHRKGFRRLLRAWHPFIFKFEQAIYRHFLNCRSVRPAFSHGTRLLHYRNFSGAEEVRHSGYRIIKNGGWHFSFMGGVDRIREKVAAYAHQENNQPHFLDPQVINERINRGVPLFGKDWEFAFVPLDESFPRYLLEHRERFSAWIKPV